MGALTSNRKRSGEDISSLLNHYTSPFLSQVFKKPKFSSMHTIINFEKHSQSIFDRIQCYPQPQERIRRQVHGPCRTPKIFISSMGNVLIKKYDDAKRLAYESCQYDNRKDKAVIDVDEDDVVVLDHSVGLNQRSAENGYVKERYENFVDKGSSSVSMSNQTVKVEDSLKEFGALSLNRELPHKKLYKSAEKRNPKLSYLALSIEIFKRKLELIIPRKKPDESLRRDREPFVPLAKEEEAEVSLALSNSNRRKLLVSHDVSSIEITGEVLQCLRPNAWLNDEVINLYFELLKEREKREPKRFLKCHFFNTFFYKKLISGKGGYDFKAVKRWTTQRKIGYGLVECEKIFVPIHKEIHWCLAIINKKDQKLQYLDSLKGKDSRVLNVLATYYVDEVKDKSGKDIDISSWKLEYVDDLPAQENGFDCGMFMIKYADFYSRGLGLCFAQENMPYFRMRTVKEILRLKAE